HVVAAGAVAERHGEIAQPAFVADAPDRRAGQARLEVLGAPREKLDEPCPVEALAGGKVAERSRTREAVPRTGELAVVAAVDPVADRRAQRFGNRTLVLDGEVRDAAPRVQPVGRDDRAGGAGVDAAGAAPAVLADRLVGRQREIGVERADEEGRAAAGVEQQRVLAAPPQAGAPGEL